MTADDLARDAEAYFARNRDALERDDDPVMRELERIHETRPVTALLELGCSTGWRLHAASRHFGCAVTGVELSTAAIEEGARRFPGIAIRQGLVPDALEDPGFRGSFDCVVIGFLMYLLPRDRLFRLAAAVDSLLADGGHVVAYDFLHPYPVRSTYAHSERMAVHKHDPSAPWSWSPTYALVGRRIEGLGEEPAAWITVDTLRKLSIDEGYAFVAPPPSRHVGEPGRPA